MTKRLAVFLAAAILVFSACGGGETEAGGLRVYYIGRTYGMESLEPHLLEIPESAESAELIAFVVAALMDESGVNGQSPVPSGVRMDVTHRGAVASVDFGEGFLELSAGRRNLSTAAVALSLLGIDGVSYIYLTVEGEGYPPFYDRAVTAGSFITEEYARPLLGRQ